MPLRLHESCFKYQNGAAPASLKSAPLRSIEPITYDPVNGFQAHFEGLKYPRPQFLNPFALKSADIVKKYLKGWLGVFSHPFHPFRAWLEYFTDISQCTLEEFVLLPQHLPRAVKEFVRVMEACGAHERLIDAVSVILDQDLNYRWPLQDVLQEIDKASFLKHPAFGVWKLVKTLSERWDGSQRAKIRSIGRLMAIFVIVSPKLRRIVKQAITELAIESIRLDQTDLYNCLLQQGYDYLGKNYEERAKMHMGLFA